MIVVLLLAAFLVPVDRFRPTIVSAIQERTGYRVAIGGLHLKLLPTVHLEVDDLKLRTPPGLPGGELLSVGRTDLDVAIAPLLRKHVHVTGLTLKDMRGRTPSPPCRCGAGADARRARRHGAV